MFSTLSIGFISYSSLFIPFTVVSKLILSYGDRELLNLTVKACLRLLRRNLSWPSLLAPWWNPMKVFQSKPMKCRCNIFWVSFLSLIPLSYSQVRGDLAGALHVVGTLMKTYLRSMSCGQGNHKTRSSGAKCILSPRSSVSITDRCLFFPAYVG